ncbi:MAG: S8 family serine peptidase, partial [Anaerolineales bacterium]|nr:S8 family serine peptidase [Anaerolineales bacterium]
MRKPSQLFITLIVLLLIAFGMIVTTPRVAAERADLKFSPQLSAELAEVAPGQMVTVIVTLKDQADLRQIASPGSTRSQEGLVRALQAQAQASQRQIIAFLSQHTAQEDGKVGTVIPFWVFNGLSVTATAEVINELAARSDVRSITSDKIELAPLSGPESAPADAQAEGNLTQINAPAVWNLGYTGQGVVVASMDSGVDVNHPDLSGRWRGGTNSWFDPYYQHPAAPVDLTGHGTWTMGIMVGGDAGGSSIGVAPGAQWIAVKIFNDAGTAQATAIHLGFQWLLDPDGNPATADAPQIVNNSWSLGGPGCDLSFQLDLQALLAAGITPVFAAGNYGSSSNTSTSPANNPEAFAVGAINNRDRIYSYSSRGPSACGEAQTVFPELVAPGVNVKTSDLYGMYYSTTGTSLSAPAASGALALLLSAYPNLSVGRLEASLTTSALDLGSAGPDNTFGYG